MCRVLVQFFLIFIIFPAIFGHSNVVSEFLSFIDKFRRPYKNGTHEFQKRFQIFKENLQRIEVLNKPYIEDGGTAVYGITNFTDMSQKEFKERFLSDLQVPAPSVGKSATLFYRSEARYAHRPSTALPKVVDWRKNGFVSAVKNQRQCGACWAFAAAEVIESAYAISLNTSAPSLAVQQLIDCSKLNQGCEGGDVCSALKYAQKEGITYEKYYPTTDEDGVCMTVPTGAETVTVSSFSCPPYIGHEDQILNILATTGPVAVAVDARTWNNYIGGIIRFHCENKINHAADIVGYDLTGPVPYYIVRNSWGTGFGIDGYIYIKIGDNLCGIAEEVASVEVKKNGGR